MKKYLFVILGLMLLTACGNKTPDERAVALMNDCKTEVRNDLSIMVTVKTDEYTNECRYLGGTQSTYARITYNNGTIENYKEENAICYIEKEDWEEVEYSRYLDAVCNLDLIFESTELTYKENKDMIIVKGKIEAKNLGLLSTKTLDKEVYDITYNFSKDKKLINIIIDNLLEFTYTFDVQV